MKHRKGKTYLRHGRIEGLDALLRIMETWEEVHSILPGEIRSVGTGGRGQGLLIRVQRAEEGKLKCVATRTGRKQELVLITPSPSIVAQKICSQIWGQ
ncbi:TPA: hypothetical protein DEB00_02960 [Candidatus Uhrbacteria bacterium]|nr:hypothetical protein [Candidatus Uhrbacteria bacterium]